MTWSPAAAPRMGASGIRAPRDHPVMAMRKEELFAPPAEGIGDMTLPSNSPLERTTPKIFKRERMGRDRVVANDILGSRRVDKCPDVAVPGGSAGSSPFSPGSAEVDGSVASSIMSRGMADMAAAKAKHSVGLTRPATVAAGDSLFEVGEFGAAKDMPPRGAVDDDPSSSLMGIESADKELSVLFFSGDAPTDGLQGVAEGELSEGRFDEMAPPFSISSMRELFSHLDDEGAGKITKNHWLDFFRKSPNLRKLLFKNEDDGALPADPESDNDARIMRKLMRQLKEVDLNKDGFIDWDEFLAYFRLRGYVLDSE